MTNKEAIDILKSILATNPPYYANKRINEAFYMACKALESKTRNEEG